MKKGRVIRWFQGTMRGFLVPDGGPETELTYFEKGSICNLSAASIIAPGQKVWYLPRTTRNGLTTFHVILVSATGEPEPLPRPAAA